METGCVISHYDTENKSVLTATLKTVTPNFFLIDDVMLMTSAVDAVDLKMWRYTRNGICLI